MDGNGGSVHGDGLKLAMVMTHGPAVCAFAVRPHGPSKLLHTIVLEKLLTISVRRRKSVGSGMPGRACPVLKERGDEIPRATHPRESVFPFLADAFRHPESRPSKKAR